jgi:hypothetical protein
MLTKQGENRMFFGILTGVYGRKRGDKGGKSGEKRFWTIRKEQVLDNFMNRYYDSFIII